MQTAIDFRFQLLIRTTFNYTKKKVEIIMRFFFLFSFIGKDIITDLNAEGEPLPIRPVNEDWMGHKVWLQDS